MLNVHRPIEVLSEVLVLDSGQRKLVALQVVRLRLAGSFFKEDTQRLQLTCVLPGELQCYAWLGGLAAKHLATQLENASDHVFLIDTTKRTDACIVGIRGLDGTFERTFAHEADLRAHR